MEDEKIISLYFSRDQSAVEQTKIKYGGMCYSVAHAILRSREDSEECVNDTYLAAWNAIPPNKPQNLGCFLAKIARNLSLKRYQYNHVKKRNRDVTVSLTELGEVLPGDGDIADEAELRELGGHISVFLRSLGVQERTAFVRRYWFFDGVRDIARSLNCTQSKVKSMLMRTRKKLANYLKINYFDGGSQ